MVEQEESFRLKLLLAYAKGRPTQIALSEEETSLSIGGSRFWKQH